jgi:hypothetical protein
MIIRTCKNCGSEINGVWKTTCPNCHNPLRFGGLQKGDVILVSGLALTTGIVLLLALFTINQLHQTSVQGVATKATPTSVSTPTSTLSPTAIPTNKPIPTSSTYKQIILPQATKAPIIEVTNSPTPQPQTNASGNTTTNNSSQSPTITSVQTSSTSQDAQSILQAAQNKYNTCANAASTTEQVCDVGCGVVHGTVVDASLATPACLNSCSSQYQSALNTCVAQSKIQ